MLIRCCCYVVCFVHSFARFLAIRSFVVTFCYVGFGFSLFCAFRLRFAFVQILCACLLFVLFNVVPSYVCSCWMLLILRSAFVTFRFVDSRFVAFTLPLLLRCARFVPYAFCSLLRFRLIDPRLPVCCSRSPVVFVVDSTLFYGFGYIYDLPRSLRCSRSRYSVRVVGSFTFPRCVVVYCVQFVRSLLFLVCCPTFVYRLFSAFSRFTLFRCSVHCWFALLLAV
jgi:hypothetical protein